MEISQFSASIPQRSWHTLTWDAWYTWIFGKRGLSGTVEDDVVETTEGLSTKKHRKVSQSTITYYSVLQRTTYYVQSTTPYQERIYNYTLESTTQYSQVFLNTTKYYSVLYKVLDDYYCILHGKIQHFALRLSPRNLTKYCAYHEKWDSKITNTAPVTKSNTPKSPNGPRAVESDSPTSPNVAPATKNVIVSFLDCYFTDWPAPFLNYSIPFLNLSFTEYSFTGHFLDWTIPFWTVPLLKLPLMNYAFTTLFFYQTIPLLN